MEVGSDFAVDFGDGLWRWGLGRTRWPTLVVEVGGLVVEFGVGVKIQRFHGNPIL